MSEKLKPINNFQKNDEKLHHAGMTHALACAVITHIIFAAFASKFTPSAPSLTLKPKIAALKITIVNTKTPLTIEVEVEPVKQDTNPLHIPPTGENTINRKTPIIPQKNKVTISSSPQSSNDVTNNIDERWRLKDDFTHPPNPTSTINAALSGITLDLECLRSKTEECRKTRTHILGELLTETERVWIPHHATTGLPSQFLGMSEHEVLTKLGVNIAGENGIYIPFTTIGIDGPFWDKLHGVTNGCKVKAGASGTVYLCPRIGRDRNGKTYQDKYTPQRR